MDASAFLKNGENIIEAHVLDIREFSWKKENGEVVMKVRSPKEITKKIVTDKGVTVSQRGVELHTP